MDDFVIYTTEQASRIANAVLESCGLELTSEVIIAEANVAKLVQSVIESKAILEPFSPSEA